MSNLRIEGDYRPEEETEEPTSNPTATPSVEHENSHNLMSEGAALGVSLAFLSVVMCGCICMNRSYSSGNTFDYQGISSGWE